MKGECIRPETPLTLGDAQRLVSKYVGDYNEERLHSAIDYVTPKDRLEGRAKEILEGRGRKLEEARERPKGKRHVRCRSMTKPHNAAGAIIGTNSDIR